MLKKTAVFIFILQALYGCAIPTAEQYLDAAYNIPSSGTSKFDGTKHIRMSNMFCGNIIIALYQDTLKADRGIVLISAGKNAVTNIGKGKSLLIKTDGETFAFESNNATTEHGNVYVLGKTMPFSHKTYIVPEAFIRKVASSSVVLAKMYQLNNKTIEGQCSHLSHQDVKESYGGMNISSKDLEVSNSASAINGFREFVQMMDSTTW